MIQARRYNNNKPKWSLVHFKSLLPLVRGLMYGEHKYSLFRDKTGNLIKGSEISKEDSELFDLEESGADNWKNPMDKKQLLNSMMRHLTAIMDGEEIDEESGIPHIGLLMCNSMFYSYHFTK